MAKWQRPRTELIQQLRNHRSALQASARGFDSGEKWEAQRLATAVYTIVHDGGKNSHSILTQLGLRSSLRFVSSSRPPTPGNFLAEHPLVLISLEDGNVDYTPRLDNGHAPPRLVQFHTWWTDESIYQAGSVSLSRRQLVFALRNRDGGGHLDAELDMDGYLTMSRDAAKGWYRQIGNEPATPLLGLELASMRQVAWELITTLDESLPADVQGVA